MSEVLDRRKIGNLKRAATRYKKGTGLTHSQALDAVAKQHGYHNWALLMRANNGSNSQAGLASGDPADLSSEFDKE